MLVAASVVTTRHDLLRRRWQLESGLPAVPGARIDPSAGTGGTRNVGATETPPEIQLTWRKDDYVIRGGDDLAPTNEGEQEYRGTFVVYDLDAREIVWREAWGHTIATPTGFVFADGVLYVADSESASVFVVGLGDELGRVTRRITNPAFNDCHGIARSRRGLLVACTGSDAIVEVDLDGKSLWEWWAAEHGYTTSPSGHARASGRGNEHRNVHYHTRYQAVHLNTVTFADPDERYVLVTLFHQGQLLRIDRRGDGTPEVLLDGLARPHAIRRIPGGWSLANSWGCEFLILDEQFRIVDRYQYDGGWMQDAVRLSDGSFALNDVDNHTIVRVSGPPWTTTDVLHYDKLWRLYDLGEVPPEHAASFLRRAPQAQEV